MLQLLRKEGFCDGKLMQFDHFYSQLFLSDLLCNEIFAACGKIAQCHFATMRRRGLELGG